MSCDQAIDFIHAALDGALGPAEARALEQHTQTCESCRSLREDLGQLVVAARELPRELTPRSDLWVGIRARLEVPRAKEPQRRSRAWAMGALALAAAVLVGLSLSWQPPLGERELDAEVAAWEQQMRGATADLERALAARQDQMDPETLAVVTRNLRIIDQAIEETRAVLAREPQDAAGRAALAALHQHKLQLLRQVVDLPQSG